MKLTVPILAVGLAVGTAYGPLTLMSEIPDGALADGGWWQHVGEETVRSGANSALAIIGLVAAAVGIPELRRRRGSGDVAGDA